ncbi:MAG: O-antigen polysaccharide polymerase Wzy [Alcanivoracaceae bacterium]|nr:O-antigen polysaccharide polymerase Wzy [Alcanivoracaceae bacterium]
MNDRLTVLLLLFFSLVSLCLSYFGGVYTALISFFFCAFFLSYFTQKVGSLNPLSWFPLFFFAYSSFYTLNEIIFTSHNGDLWLGVFLGHLALAAFSLPVLGYYIVKGMHLYRPEIKYSLPAGLFYVVWAVCGAAIFWVFLGGFKSKREVIDSFSGSISSYLMISFLLLAAISIIRNIESFRKGAGFWEWKVGISFFVLLLGYGVTGERDFVFRYLFMLVVVLFLYRWKFSAVYPALIILAMAFLLPLSQALKGVVIVDHVDFSLVSQRSIFENEFSSAGRNLQYVIDSKLTRMNGLTYVWDFRRAMPFVEGGQSAGKWFNEVLRMRYGDGGTSGWGFSLVAEGYMNFGKMGVAVQYFVLGVITLVVFLLSRRGGLYLLFYVFYLASFIYVQRADLANYLGFCFKLNLFIVFCVWFAVKGQKVLLRKGV